jgi:hypothetical protein
MSKSVSQKCIPFMVVGNCGTESGLLPLLALFVNKLYNVNVSIVSKDAKSLFISVLKGRLGTESCFWQLTVETAEPSFLIGIK